MTERNPPPPAPMPGPSTGLGGWSLYFILKLLLAWRGALSAHPAPDLAFALVLLLPLRRRWLRLARDALAWPPPPFCFTTTAGSRLPPRCGGSCPS
ncbi:cellulose synthase operon protein YhjU [Chromobacterium violaceum]|uniref:Cellulose synthase operon protein YhjU n=1 Tax=Chromobacterium violaceum TaxID=536 RepID=A0A3S5DLL9_CHRVL|nr:cellulose synthase operon protein YhjU [Chromobacterium violaceum]